MKIIKLGRGPDGLDSRNGVFAYFSGTLMLKNRIELFGATAAKSKMSDVAAWTLLVFTFDACCMLIYRSSGLMV